MARVAVIVEPLRIHGYGLPDAIRGPAPRRARLPSGPAARAPVVPAPGTRKRTLDPFGGRKRGKSLPKVRQTDPMSRGSRPGRQGEGLVRGGGSRAGKGLRTGSYAGRYVYPCALRGQ